MNANHFKRFLCFPLSQVTAQDVLERFLRQPTTTSVVWESPITPRWQVCVIISLQFQQRNNNEGTAMLNTMMVMWWKLGGWFRKGDTKCFTYKIYCRALWKSRVTLLKHVKMVFLYSQKQEDLDSTEKQDKSPVFVSFWFWFWFFRFLSNKLEIRKSVLTAWFMFCYKANIKICFKHCLGFTCMNASYFLHTMDMQNLCFL